MSFRPSSADRPPTGRPALHLPRWPRYLLPVVGGLIALGILVTIIAGVWTDRLWYSSVQYGSVFDVIYGTRWALFFVVGIFMAAVVGVNAWLAYRLRPVYRPAGAERPGVEAYRMAVDPHRKLLLAILLSLIGVITGITASGAWRTWLLFINQVPFGRKDAQFGLDLSFFIFTYPFLRLVLSYLFAAVFLSLLAAVAVHVLYGGLGWQARRPRATVGAQAHLFVLVGVFVLLKGVAYWVDRWGIDFSQRGAVTTGASYTDVNAVLPAKTVLAVIAVLCAVLFFAGAVRRSALLPAVGLGLLVLSAILIGGVYPAIIQQFVVKPNELAKETPYITREIRATRLAYAVTGTKYRGYSGTSSESSADLLTQSSSLPGFRLMDPAVVSRAFQQLQQVKGFYQFPDTLSVDRYVLPGERQPQDLAVAVRGLSGPPAGQGNWINTHLVYTHGFGFVAAKENSVAGGGTPDYVESDLPPRGQLRIDQPRVYFGQAENNYVIVGGPPGRPGQELDYPYSGTGGQKNYTYIGTGGVPVGSPLNRLLYAIKFRELNILLSGAINNYSKILYERTPLARVAKVAPFLTLDGNPYPVVANHRIYWIVDGYTTTDLYPYSQRLSMPAATSTSQTPSGRVAGKPAGAVNYIRNSVKAVVDAYNGNVTLYQWGAADPLLEAWKNAFGPGIIQPRSAIPGDLLPHMRYPTDLFEVQREILTQYHVGSAQSFYGGQNFWAIPNDPTGLAANQHSQPPYYLTETIPGYRQPQFSLTTTFVPRNRANLAAVMVVNSNPTRPGYGTIRVLQLPQAAVTEGPSQVQGAFESNAAASAELTLLRRGGSIVTLGNMITIPVGGGLLYIEPVYVSAAAAGSTGSYPSLQRVFAFYAGHPVGFQPTLQEALTQVFTGTSGQTTPGGGAGGGPGGSVSARVIADLKLAQQYYADAQAALRRGDLAAYGEDIAKMAQQISNAQAAAKAGHAAATPPKPSPGATATPTPSPSASR